MLVVETIAKIRRAYFQDKKPINPAYSSKSGAMAGVPAKAL
jgi:hypothetical protein